MGTAIEFSGISPEVIDELAKGRLARETIEKVKLLQQYGGYAGSPEGTHRTIDGLGQFKQSIPPFAYHYWGQRLGYDCWKDKQFRAEFARDNPGIRVGYHSPASVGYARPDPKFSKTYSWPIAHAMQSK